MSKKTFSIDTIFAYHTARAKEGSTYRDGQKNYSRNWLDGYNDSKFDRNFESVCREIERAKIENKERMIALYGYKNGLKARQESKKHK